MSPFPTLCPTCRRTPTPPTWYCDDCYEQTIPLCAACGEELGDDRQPKCEDCGEPVCYSCRWKGHALEWLTGWVCEDCGEEAEKYELACREAEKDVS